MSLFLIGSFLTYWWVTPILLIHLIITGQRVLQVEARHHHHGATKLFVFGDSYADTGNIQKGISNSWKYPYGITFPGKPAGRFSDGRVLTDYIGKCNSSATTFFFLPHYFTFSFFFLKKRFCFWTCFVSFHIKYYML